MRSDEHHHHPHAGVLASRRRLPFDSTAARMTSSVALKRAGTSTFRYPHSLHHHEHSSTNNRSSSSSITEDDDDDDDGEVRMLDDTIPENGIGESDKRKTTLVNSRHLTMNNDTKRETNGSGPMIQELLQSNMDLKKEIRDIRRQIKHNHSGVHKQRVDRAITTTHSSANKTKTFDDHDCSLLPAEPDHYHNDQSTTMSQLQQYKLEATAYKQQLDTCQDTIAHLRKTIDTMEKRLEQLRTVEQRPAVNLAQRRESFTTTTNNNTDHRFIHELFHLCIKHTTRTSKLRTTVPSHQDMKTFIRRTFNDLLTSSSSSAKLDRNEYELELCDDRLCIEAMAKHCSPVDVHRRMVSFEAVTTGNGSNHEINHFICKCSDRVYNEHRPSYQFCLGIIEQCQSLFDTSCFTQLPTTLNELYYRHGELINFKRSIASTLGVTESMKTVSCPKLIKTLQQTLDDAKSNELITFKKMAKINDMNEAITKIRSYDDFVPYYHQFIEQMANLLEVSKGDEIMPAIKTLKLLAHTDSRRHSSREQLPITRTSSMNVPKNFRHSSQQHKSSLTHSKSFRTMASTSHGDTLIDMSKMDSIGKQNDESEQQRGGTDDGDS